MARTLPLLPVLNIARRLGTVHARAGATAQHDLHVVAGALRGRLRDRFGAGLRELRVLDFGCGYTYPLVASLQPEVAEITGVDVAPVYRDGLAALLRYSGGWRRPGPAADAFLIYLHARAYFRHLSARVESHPVAAPYQELNLVRYDGERLPFPDASFHCVISNAVLQELPLPLERFAAEIARVLAPGGWVDLEWHNFYALTGNYLGEAASRKNPWGHLLGGRYHRSLNRLTPDQVRAAFAARFHDLRVLAHDRWHRLRTGEPGGLGEAENTGDRGYQPEGEEYLTPKLESRLASFPREWLTARGFVLQGAAGHPG